MASEKEVGEILNNFCQNGAIVPPSVLISNDEKYIFPSFDIPDKERYDSAVLNTTNY